MERDIKIVLVGKTGHGKSSSANTITFEKDKDPLFLSSSEPGSCTVKNKHVTKEIRGRLVTVIDTPGTEHSRMPEPDLAKEIYGVVNQNDEGIDAFLITLRWSSDGLSKDDRRTLKLLHTVYGGTAFFDHVIFLFTHGDKFVKAQEDTKKLKLGTLPFLEEITNDMYSTSEEAVGPVLKKAKCRAVLFNNSEKSPEKKFEMQEDLMKMIDKVVNIEGYKPYTRKLLPDESKLPKKKWCSVM